MKTPSSFVSIIPILTFFRHSSFVIRYSLFPSFLLHSTNDRKGNRDRGHGAPAPRKRGAVGPRGRSHPLHAHRAPFHRSYPHLHRPALHRIRRFHASDL